MDESDYSLDGHDEVRFDGQDARVNLPDVVHKTSVALGFL